MPQSILAGLNEEATQLELLSNITVLLSAMLEKMPRVTGNDQCAVSVEGTATVAFAPNQVIHSITGTLAALTSLNQLGGRATLPVADAQVMTGTSHIYNNITVSA
jgi:hypothetical protein